ncbi:MAG: hypothetical protein PSX36_13345 [bacterium]|nr:hypothetical protein [bacterium]
MKRALYIVFLLLFVICLKAQNSGKKHFQADSLRNKLAMDSARIFRKTFAKPYFKFENSISLFGEDRVNLLGFMGGVTMLQRHSVSAGYYFLDSKNNGAFPVNQNGIESYHFTDIHYFAVGYQYVLLNKRFFLINTPFTVGYGSYQVDIIRESDQLMRTDKAHILPLYAGLQLVLKPTKWMGVSGTVGYRTISSLSNSQLKLTGLFYSVGIWMDARIVNRTLRYQRKKHIYRREIHKLDHH